MITIEDIESHLGHRLTVKYGENLKGILFCKDDGKILLEKKQDRKSSNCCPICDMVFSKK